MLELEENAATNLADIKLMSNLQEIERAISQLSAEELADFR